MAGDESRMAGGESHMTGDCCRLEGFIHRCVRTHSHLYSYIYGLVAFLDSIQSSFSSITISTNVTRESVLQHIYFNTGRAINRKLLLILGLK